MKYVITDSQFKMIKKYMKNFINEGDVPDWYIRGDYDSNAPWNKSDEPDENDEYYAPVERHIDITITDKHNGKPLMLVQIAAESNEEGFLSAELVDVIPNEKIFFKKIEDKVNFIKSYFEKLESSKKLIDFIDKTNFDNIQGDLLEKSMSFSEFQS